jgi:hypothetical protein
MFSFLLKLLGIKEEKPVSRDNSFLANKPHNQTAAPTTPTASTEISTTSIAKKPEPVVTDKSPERKTEATEKTFKEKADEKAAATKASIEKPKAPEPKPKAEPKPKPKAESKAEKAKTRPKAETAAKADSLEQVFPDLKANFVQILMDAGYKTKADIDKADDKALLALKGIGQATLKILRDRG